MVKSCVAYNCKNRFKKGSSITFHKFPMKDERRLQQWLLNLRLKDFTPTRYKFLCSDHFKADCFYKNYAYTTQLKSDAVPTEFNFRRRMRKVLHPKELLKQTISRDNVSRKLAKDLHSYSIAPRMQKKKLVSCDFSSTPSNTLNPVIVVVSRTSPKRVSHTRMRISDVDGKNDANDFPLDHEYYMELKRRYEEMLEEKDTTYSKEKPESTKLNGSVTFTPNIVFL